MERKKRTKHQFVRSVGLRPCPGKLGKTSIVRLFSGCQACARLSRKEKLMFWESIKLGVETVVFGFVVYVVVRVAIEVGRRVLEGGVA